MFSGSVNFQSVFSSVSVNVYIFHYVNSRLTLNILWLNSSILLVCYSNLRKHNDGSGDMVGTDSSF